MKFEDEKNRVWGNLYFIDNFNEKVTLQETEVESLHLWTKEELEANIKLVEEGSQEMKITPDSIQAYKEFRKCGI